MKPTLKDKTIGFSLCIGRSELPSDSVGIDSIQELLPDEAGQAA